MTAMLGSKKVDVVYRLNGEFMECEFGLMVFGLLMNLNDVATPYEPWTVKESAYDCNKYGPDGYLDLILQFKAQEIVASRGPVSDGEVIVVQLAVNLKDEFGGTEFFGEEVVRMLVK